MKNRIKNLIALLFGVMLTIFIAEIFLQISQPFGFRQKGDNIVLPANVKYTFQNKNIEKLDSIIVHTKNSLGFRGPEIPEGFDDFISIITIGGSTTECLYISDGNDWSSILSKKLKNVYNNIWINNAGLDGHSTFGHYILLKDHLIKLNPKYVIFLVGCNDIGRTDLNNYDKKHLSSLSSGWKNYLKNHSELISLIVNLRRSWRSKKHGLGHTSIDLLNTPQLTEVDTFQISKQLRYHQSFLEAYTNRLHILIELSKQYNITPIFITQPSLVGKGYDDITNVNLEKVQACNKLGGKAYWLILELYNEITRKVVNENGILLIDLASVMPKSSKYFYDCLHFTNEGNQQVARILFEAINQYFLLQNLAPLHQNKISPDQTNSF